MTKLMYNIAVILICCMHSLLFAGPLDSVKDDGVRWRKTLNFTFDNKVVDGCDFDLHHKKLARKQHDLYLQLVSLSPNKYKSHNLALLSLSLLYQTGDNAVRATVPIIVKGEDGKEFMFIDQEYDKDIKESAKEVERTEETASYEVYGIAEIPSEIKALEEYEAELANSFKKLHENLQKKLISSPYKTEIENEIERLHNELRRHKANIAGIIEDPALLAKECAQRADTFRTQAQTRFPTAAPGEPAHKKVGMLASNLDRDWRHSEQYILEYLETPDRIERLINLIAGSLSDTDKVLGVVLNIHTRNDCCARCALSIWSSCCSGGGRLATLIKKIKHSKFDSTQFVMPLVSSLNEYVDDKNSSDGSKGISRRELNLDSDSLEGKSPDLKSFYQNELFIQRYIAREDIILRLEGEEGLLPLLPAPR